MGLEGLHDDLSRASWSLFYTRTLLHNPIYKIYAGRYFVSRWTAQIPGAGNRSFSVGVTVDFSSSGNVHLHLAFDNDVIVQEKFKSLNLENREISILTFQGVNDF